MLHRKNVIRIEDVEQEKTREQDGRCARAWIEIDKDALRKNVEFLQERLPKDCKLMPAVKANAYGHGAVLVARFIRIVQLRY